MEGDYTNVLKGLINLSKHIFNDKATARELDEIARRNIDFMHSTGHGVGQFLNVHEKFVAIASKNENTFLEGQVLSIEPGIYKENQYGIRLENLYYISKTFEDDLFNDNIDNNELKFNVLTLVPFDKNLINFDFLDKDEKEWLSNYNNLILLELKKYLEKDIYEWLADYIN